jgi:phage baseplate assembly protein V
MLRRTGMTRGDWLGVRRLLDAVKTRVALTLARGVVRAVRDAGKLQELQVELLRGEVAGRLERFQQYGFTSNPHAGAEAVAVFVGGNRDHGIVLAVDDRRYRLKPLAAGEVALYTDEGDRIHFKRGRIVEIVTGTLKVNATTALDITAGGNRLVLDAAGLRVNSPLVDFDL